MYQNIYILQKKNIKSIRKATQGTLTDFAYCSSYLQAKENAWKQNDAIFLEPEMLWSWLCQFQKALIKIEKNESLMALSLAPK